MDHTELKEHRGETRQAEARALDGSRNERIQAVAKAVRTVLGEPAPDNEIAAVYLHGSALLDRFHRGSDLDIAVLYIDGVSEDRRLVEPDRMADALRPLVGRPVDAVDVPGDRYSVLGDIVARSGVPVWVADPSRVAAWQEMLARTRPWEYTPAGVREEIRRIARLDRAC
jgi:predicted nucleotidyltransferase